MDHNPIFEKMLTYLEKLPALNLPVGRKSIASGHFDNGNWWLKFTIDTEHSLAWRHVQELGHVLNYLSLDERLPAVFIPVSPPPYMNGGAEFLSWVIESTNPTFTPDTCADWLKGRLPDPVEDVSAWNIDFDWCCFTDNCSIDTCDDALHWRGNAPYGVNGIWWSYWCAIW